MQDGMPGRLRVTAHSHVIAKNDQEEVWSKQVNQGLGSIFRTESFSMQAIAKRLVRKITLSQPFTRIYDRLNPVDSLGQKGERAAERHLLGKNYVIIERGFQDKFGEIDLIAVDTNTIVFVEVKTRTNDSHGSPAEAVDETKQTRLTKTATGYLKWHRLTDCQARFDVVAVTWPDQNQPPEIVHYEHAFEPVGKFQIF